MSSGDTISLLEARLGLAWDAIRRARTATSEKRAELTNLLTDRGAPDAVFAVFGSLGRGEYTSQSDLDWTLLVDGPAAPSQLTVASEIRAALKDVVSPPTGGGPFGSLSSSFELVHRIGGDADTNRIMTQRVLLLLESVPLATDPNCRDELVYERVVRSILTSYLDQSAGVRAGTGVPQFLLNDVVRYWRTMTVDYSAKRRERDDDGWALRRLKLRTSRKLIFAAGLVTCLDYHVRVVSPGGKPDRDELLENLVEHVNRTPLESLAYVALQHPELHEAAGKVFSSYDRFLTLLDDASCRDDLKRLARRDAEGNASYARAEAIGSEFGAAIESYFFDTTYKRAIREYGVF